MKHQTTSNVRRAELLKDIENDTNDLHRAQARYFSLGLAADDEAMKMAARFIDRASRELDAIDAASAPVQSVREEEEAYGRLVAQVNALADELMDARSADMMEIENE